MQVLEFQINRSGVLGVAYERHLDLDLEVDRLRGHSLDLGLDPSLQDENLAADLGNCLLITISTYSYLILRLLS